MSIEKAVSLLKDKNFLLKLDGLKDPKKLVEIFKIEGVNISEEKANLILETFSEIYKNIINDKIIDDDLSYVSGGGGVIKKSIALLFMAGLAYESNVIYKKVGGLENIKKPKILKKLSWLNDSRIEIENKVANWLKDET